MEKLLPFLLDVFFPYLKPARILLHYALNRNGTKVLAYACSGLGFRCRTKDEEQYYYDFKCSLLGKITVYQTQYIESGKPVNLFMGLVVPTVMDVVSGKEIDESDTEGIEEVTRKVFESRVLTKSQFFKAVHQIRRLPMNWFRLSTGESDESNSDQNS